MFPLLHLLQRNVACHVAWWRLSCFVGGLCWFAPPHSPLLFVLEQEVDDSWWFNDQYAVNDGTNASKSIQTTWISSLFVGLWELPCIGHVDLRFSWTRVLSMQKVSVWMLILSWLALNALLFMSSEMDLKRLASDQPPGLRNRELAAYVWVQSDLTISMHVRVSKLNVLSLCTWF